MNTHIHTHTHTHTKEQSIIELYEQIITYRQTHSHISMAQKVHDCYIKQERKTFIRSGAGQNERQARNH